MKIKCEDCKEYFDHFTPHINHVTKKVCQRCLCRRKNMKAISKRSDLTMKASDAKIIINEINKINKKLSINDASFLSSVTLQVNSGYSISERQEKCLLRIYEKVTGGGVYQRREYSK